MKIGNTEFTIENLSSDLSADHCPIIINFRTGAAQLYQPKPITHINGTQFEADIENWPYPAQVPYSTSAIDREINELAEYINQCVKNNTNVFTPKFSRLSLLANIKAALSLNAPEICG